MMSAMPARSVSHAVGLKVQELRSARGWSQEVAARRLQATGLSWRRSQVTELETGRRDLALSEIFLLAETFGVGVHELLPESGQIAIGKTERPAAILRGMLAGQPAPNSDLHGPTDIPGLDPAEHGSGPYWVRNMGRASYVYSAEEVDEAKRLGLDIEEYRRGVRKEGQ
jgi:transcriptional regulator with XRE-family HTH domain